VRIRRPIAVGADWALVRLASGEYLCVDTTTFEALGYILGWEHEADVIRVFRTFLTQRSVVLDIGANFGLYTALSASIVKDHGRLYAFEGNPRVFESLQRTIAANDFFVDTFTTSLEPNEILREIRIATPPPGSKGVYLKFSRRSQDWAIVAVAAQVRVTGHEVTQVAVGLTGMGNRPIRASGVEQALRGKAAHDEDLRKAAERAADGTNPQQDLNGSPDYRRHLAQVLTRRALEQITAHH